MELEQVRLQDQRLLLGVREKAEKLQPQQEDHQKQDAVRFQKMEDGKSVSKYRAEKWQRVEFTPQLQLEELGEIKKIAAQREKWVKRIKNHHMQPVLYHICFSSPREVIEKMLQLKASMEAALIRIKVTQVMRILAWNDVLYSLIIS